MTPLDDQKDDSKKNASDASPDIDELGPFIPKGSIAANNVVMVTVNFFYSKEVYSARFDNPEILITTPAVIFDLFWQSVISRRVSSMIKLMGPGS